MGKATPFSTNILLTELISILVGANGPGILACLTQSSTDIASLQTSS